MSVSQCTPLRNLKTTIEIMASTQMTLRRDAMNLYDHELNPRSTNTLYRTHNASIVWLEGYDASAEIGRVFITKYSKST